MPRAPVPVETWIDLDCGCSTSERHCIVNVRCVAHADLVPGEDRRNMGGYGLGFGTVYGPLDGPLWPRGR